MYAAIPGSEWMQYELVTAREDSLSLLGDETCYRSREWDNAITCTLLKFSNKAMLEAQCQDVYFCTSLESVGLTDGDDDNNMNNRSLQ